jgi:hypothetical protein
MHDDHPALPVAQRLREAICCAKTEAALDAVGRELREAGAAGELTAQEYADLKALGRKVRIDLRNVEAGRLAPRIIARLILEAIRLARSKNELEGVYQATQRARILCPGEDQLIHEAYTQRTGELDALGVELPPAPAAAE